MEDVSCSVCCEPMDMTDQAVTLCENCTFNLCLWCYHRICEDAGKLDQPARCPNCRSAYDQEHIRRQRLDPAKLEEVKRKVKVEVKKKPSASTSKLRKDLANVRVVQRNLVYVVGLALDLCYEDKLKSVDYFGRFGRVVKISVSRGGPYGSAAAKNGPSGSAYVTFRREDDARRCIETIHGTVWEGKPVKACYGTTKYCNAFLKGLPCNNDDCLYLHEVADEEDSYTKEETKSTKFVNLVHAASLNHASSNSHERSASLRADSLTIDQQQGFEAALSTPEIASEPLPQAAASSPGAAWPSLGSATWASRASEDGASASQPAPLLTEDPQAWPQLSGSPGNLQAGDAPQKEQAALAQNGLSMAAQLASVSSSDSTTHVEEPGRRGSVLVVPKKKMTALRDKARPSRLSTAVSAEGKGDEAARPDNAAQQQRQPGGQAQPPGTPPLAAKVPSTSLLEAQMEATRHVPVPGTSAAWPDAGARTKGPPPGFEPGPALKASSAGQVEPPPGFHIPSAAASVPTSAASASPSWSVLSTSLHSIWTPGPSGAASAAETDRLEVLLSRGLGSDPVAIPVTNGVHRSRSRFTFAQNEDRGERTYRPSLEQPRTPEPFASQVNGHVGWNGGILPGYKGMEAEQKRHSADGGSSFGSQDAGEMSPGLLLLRKLQGAQGLKSPAASPAQPHVGASFPSAGDAPVQSLSGQLPAHPFSPEQNRPVHTFQSPEKAAGSEQHGQAHSVGELTPRGAGRRSKKNKASTNRGH